MIDPKTIQESLINKFGLLNDAVVIQRPKRIFVDIGVEKFRDMFKHAVKDLGFSVLLTITGLDEGEKFGFIYHMGDESGIILNIKTHVKKSDAVINTITDLFPNAEIYEREIADLLGVKFEGLKPGIRYPLPDDWPQGQFPLRKDWKKDNKAQAGDAHA